MLLYILNCVYVHCAFVVCPHRIRERRRSFDSFFVCLAIPSKIQWAQRHNIKFIQFSISVSFSSPCTVHSTAHINELPQKILSDVWSSRGLLLPIILIFRYFFRCLWVLLRFRHERISLNVNTKLAATRTRFNVQTYFAFLLIWKRHKVYVPLWSVDYLAGIIACSNLSFDSQMNMICRLDVMLTSFILFPLILILIFLLLSLQRFARSFERSSRRCSVTTIFGGEARCGAPVNYNNQNQHV